MSDKMRSVNTKFWDDSFIQELNPSEKLLFLYLITNPLTNILGIYEISIRRISFDTGLNKDTILKGLERFEKVQKAFYIDEFIILPNFLKNQKLNANMKIGVSKIFNELPKNVKEKLPIQTRREESDKVLVYKTDINGNKGTALMSYNHLQGFWNTMTGTCKVSHWQPLPKAPK